MGLHEQRKGLIFVREMNLNTRPRFTNNFIASSHSFLNYGSISSFSFYYFQTKSLMVHWLASGYWCRRSVRMRSWAGLVPNTY